MAFDKSKFIEQFKLETRERLQALNLGLLRLEKSPRDPALLNSLMRDAHSIKGAARLLGFKRIEEITHKMEDGLQRALAGDLEVTPACVDVLFQCLDGLELLLEDKVVWSDAGVDRNFTEELCALADEAFSGRLQGPAARVVGRRKERPAEDAAPVAALEHFLEPPGSQDSVRVDTRKLNRLINISGELLISKIRLEELSRSISSLPSPPPQTRDLAVVAEHMDKLTDLLRSEMLQVRMLPVAYLFNTFPRAMRDLAREKGKEIDFSIEGQDTQLDKAILDEMRAPLMHILRNAVDHGIEPPRDRKSLGKPETGRLTLSARQEGSQVVLSVADDGRGIDSEAVKRRAVEKGLVSADHIGHLGPEAVFNLLFAPGFSTEPGVSDTSGRGVGLDVVRETVARLKGMVEVRSRPGGGCSFVVRLPLTLAITESLLVKAGGDDFAIPVDAVIETIRIGPGDVKSVETKDVITVHGHVVPLVRLHDLFGLPAKGIVEKRLFPVVIVQSVEKRVALLVDSLLGRQEIIGKSLGDPLQRVRDIAGATILGSGKVVLILDVPSIIAAAEGGVVRRSASGGAAVQARIKKKKTILLAEDVLSTAMLEKSILESVGYAVVIARDGQEALQKASQENFDLVITDVLMPRMDGFELVRRLRGERRYADVPILILTTRESDEDKRKGMEAGANAYLLKSDFTSEGLLETMERLLG
jgi:chemotaxis protein histidine kinase CheA/CheY-like chemotaxis protein